MSVVRVCVASMGSTQRTHAYVTLCNKHSHTCKCCACFTSQWTGVWFGGGVVKFQLNPFCAQTIDYRTVFNAIPRDYCINGRASAALCLSTERRTGYVGHKLCCLECAGGKSFGIDMWRGCSTADQADTMQNAHLSRTPHDKSGYIVSAAAVGRKL